MPKTVKHMWRPSSVGDVIAERTFDLYGKTRRAGRLTVQFGRPIQEPGATSRDAWWCPVRVKGSGLDEFQPVAGVDALQALILALEFVTRVVSRKTERRGLTMAWLGTAEQAVLARHSLSRDVEGVLWTLYCALHDTASILSSNRDDEQRVISSLNRIIDLTPFSARSSVRRKTARKRPKSAF